MSFYALDYLIREFPVLQPFSYSVEVLVYSVCWQSLSHSSLCVKKKLTCVCSSISRKQISLHLFQCSVLPCLPLCLMLLVMSLLACLFLDLFFCCFSAVCRGSTLVVCTFSHFPQGIIPAFVSCTCFGWSVSFHPRLWASRTLCTAVNRWYLL